MLTREAFFALKPEIKEFQIPALGGSVHIKQLTVRERERLEADNAKADGRGYRRRAVVATVCNADGSPMFTAGDVEALSPIPAYALDKIVDEATRFNKLDDNAVAEEKKD